MLAAGFGFAGLSVADGQQTPQVGVLADGLMPYTGQANLTHFQRHNFTTLDRRAHFLMKAQNPSGPQTTQSIRLFSTDSKAASSTSVAPTEYRRQLPDAFAGTMTMAGSNSELNSSGGDSTCDVLVTSTGTTEYAHVVYNVLDKSTSSVGQSGIRYVRLRYVGGASSPTASYWTKEVDVPVVPLDSVHLSGQAHKSYIRPAIAIYPGVGSTPDEIWVTEMQVNVSATANGETPPPTYTYLAYKGTPSGSSVSFQADAAATAAFIHQPPAPPNQPPSESLDRAETRSIRPLACQGLLAMLFTDARNIDNFEDTIYINEHKNPPISGGIPEGYSQSAPVSFFLTVRKVGGDWTPSYPAIYSRQVDDEDGTRTAFVKQYDGDGAHFSAVATAYTDRDGNLAPAIHVVTNDGNRTGLYARIAPGEGMNLMHSFPIDFPPPNGTDYSMQAAYMHIAYDPDSKKLLAAFSANDNRGSTLSSPGAKAILTFTSTNGGRDWNDSTPYVMTAYSSPNKDPGEPRFEMPAIISYPHVYLQQYDDDPPAQGMENSGADDFLFRSYFLPYPTGN